MTFISGALIAEKRHNGARWRSLLSTLWNSLPSALRDRLWTCFSGRWRRIMFISHKHSHFYFIKQIHKRNRQTVGQCSFAFHCGRRSCTGPPFVCFVYVFVWWNKNDCAYDYKMACSSVLAQRYRFLWCVSLDAVVADYYNLSFQTQSAMFFSFRTI